MYYIMSGTFMQGKTYEELHGKKKAKELRKGCSNRMIKNNWIGENSPTWKGDKVGYYGLHWWARKHIPKTKLCGHCKLKSPRHFANISGTYKRDLNDWIWLCVPCHSKHDGKTKPRRGCLICGIKVNQYRNIYCSRKCKGLGEKKFGKCGRRDLHP